MSTTVTRSKRTSAAKSKTSEPRTRLDQFEDVIAARQKLDELRQGLGNLEHRHAALLEKAGLPTGHGAEVRLRAQQLLAGESHTEEPDVRGELRGIEQDVETARAAIAMQNQTLANTVQRASKEICTAVWPQHAAIINRIDAALATLIEALDGEERFRGELGGRGVLILRPIIAAPLAVRFPTFAQRTFSRGRRSWRRRLETAGYFQTEEKPNGQ